MAQYLASRTKNMDYQITDIENIPELKHRSKYFSIIEAAKSLPEGKALVVPCPKDKKQKVAMALKAACDAAGVKVNISARGTDAVYLFRKNAKQVQTA